MYNPYTPNVLQKPQKLLQQHPKQQKKWHALKKDEHAKLNSPVLAWILEQHIVPSHLSTEQFHRQLRSIHEQYDKLYLCTTGD